MNDDRPLHVLASRVAYMFALPLINAQKDYPADKRLRARWIDGVVHTAEHMEPAPVWLEFGRGLDGGCSYQVVATDGKKLRRVILTGRTPKQFREAFDALERGVESFSALRPWRLYHTGM